MEIRPARLDESEALARILWRCRNEMEYLPTVPETDISRIAAAMFEYHDEVWIADAGRPLGFLALRGDTLEKLYVDPGEQRRRIGTVLLEKAKELRPNHLELWVFQKNAAARRFYERHGFELVKLTDGAANMEREPDALYVWTSPAPVRAA